jgi:hypothetical protein
MNLPIASGSTMRPRRDDGPSIETLARSRGPSRSGIWRIEAAVVVYAKSEKRADKLLSKMLDAIEDELVTSTAAIEEVTDE